MRWVGAGMSETTLLDLDVGLANLLLCKLRPSRIRATRRFELMSKRTSSRYTPAWLFSQNAACHAAGPLQLLEMLFNVSSSSLPPRRSDNWSCGGWWYIAMPPWACQR